MGYYAHLHSGNATITNVAAAEAAVKVDPVFSWAWAAGIKGLPELLEDSGFQLEEEADGGLLISYFEGKWREQEAIFNTIAPWVEGFLGFVGEDNELWGWEFEGEKLHYKYAKIEWV